MLSPASRLSGIKWVGVGRWERGRGGGGGGGGAFVENPCYLISFLSVSQSLSVYVCMQIFSAFLVQEQSPKRTAIAHKTFSLNGDDFENC